MKKIAIVVFIGLTMIVSCSKEHPATSDSLAGTWVFTNQVTTSYAYPSVIKNNTSPIAQSSWSTTLDSIKIMFDGSGHYTFLNFRLPIDKGSYHVAQDSLLIIKPDTAGFVKFNYSAPAFSAGSGVPANGSYAPYATFQFSTDTIRFKASGDNITFSGAWLTKANAPLIPTNDTLILNQLLNYFKRQ